MRRAPLVLLFSTVLLFATVLAAATRLASPARAQEALEPRRAETPERAIALLKEAWDARDDAAVVARHADPGASLLRRELAARRRIEAARTALARSVKQTLGGGAAVVELGLDEELPPLSPLHGCAIATADASREGERATVRVRVAQKTGGERRLVFNLVDRAGDWKVVLSSPDGTPLGDAQLVRHGAATDVREKTAQELEALAADAGAGKLGGKDAVRRRLGEVREREERALSRLADEAREAGRKGPRPPRGSDDDDDE